MYKTSRSWRVRKFHLRRLRLYSLAALSIIFWFLLICISHTDGLSHSVVNDANVSSEDCSVAIVAACKGKESTLHAALDSWLGARDVSRIYLIDWSSAIPYTSSLAPRFLHDDKIRVVRVDEQENYVLTWAVNFAFSHARECERVLKLDCDSVITSDFIARNPLSPSSFLSGDWRAARDDNEVHINGLLYINSKDFWSIGGYDERISSYGYDDEDLYARLTRKGLERKLFDMDTIHHLYHSSALRIENVPAMTKNADFETAVNRILSETLPPWNASSEPRTIFTKRGASYTISKATPSSRTTASSEQFRSAVKGAAYEFFITLAGYKWAPAMDILPPHYLTQLVNSHFLAEQMSKTKRMIIVHLQHGFGNRLRTLSSAIHFAKESDRWLRIVSPWIFILMPPWGTCFICPGIRMMFGRSLIRRS